MVGTGTLTISMGSTSFAVTITDDKKTLADVRDAINNATSNVGVKATLVKAQDGTRLVLTGTGIGAANAVKVKAAGGDGGLNQLVYDPGVLENLDVVRARAGRGDRRFRLHDQEHGQFRSKTPSTD